MASTLGTVPLKTPTATFRCCICLENVPLSTRWILGQCGRESHGSCSECLKTYVRLRVDERRVNELCCPRRGDDGCQAKVTERELQAWMSPELCEKFERFVSMDADPKLRACPQCSRLCSPGAAEDCSVVAEMRCEHCPVDFCYYHSNAHPPGKEACAEYERTVVKQMACDGAMKGTKQCPKCGFQTEKASGCNHMTCKCKVDWCWTCGQQLDNVGWHYNPMNPKGCMQFQDDGVARRDRMMIFAKVLALPAVLCTLAFIIVFVALLMVTCFVPLCVCCKERGIKIWIAIAGCIVALPFCIFSLAWAVVGMLLWCMLLPCGADEVHFQFFLGVPFMTALAIGESFSRYQD